MKKILLGLFALTSISAMAAEGVNFYGRVGLDVFSHYNKVSEKDADGEATLKSRGKVAPSVALEVTKDLDSNLELGLGLAYVSHGKRDFKIVDIDAHGNKEITEGKYPAVNSVPLYVTGKYKFSNSDVKPYVKADLGYSFNKMKKSSDVEGAKAKNGLYTAVGVGVEYMNVTADLAYVFTGAKVKISDEGTSESVKANNSAIRLTVGYKFSI